MAHVSEKSKLLYLVILIIFLVGVGFFWLDYIGFLNMEKVFQGLYKKEAPSVLYSDDDEPSLIQKEEFEKAKVKLSERVESLDKREAMIQEKEKELADFQEKLDEVKKSLDLEKEKLEKEKKQYSGYKRNVEDLAKKIGNMPPEKSVNIMVKWEEPLIIDVLRQMDADATAAGRSSITSYLISLMPEKKASRIMYLMTQI